MVRHICVMHKARQRDIYCHEAGAAAGAAAGTGAAGAASWYLIIEASFTFVCTMDAYNRLS